MKAGGSHRTCLVVGLHEHAGLVAVQANDTRIPIGGFPKLPDQPRVATYAHFATPRLNRILYAPLVPISLDETTP